MTTEQQLKLYRTAFHMLSEGALRAFLKLVKLDPGSEVDNVADELFHTLICASAVFDGVKPPRDPDAEAFAQLDWGDLFP